ncbi:hypothetical protein CSHISOI_02968, partial [Colletotrichum shisoi]
MIVNIELARITGQTMDAVYGTKGKAVDRLDPAKSGTKNTVSMWELDQISSSCVEAAGCSLEVLDAVKEQRIIAKFGFFDPDAAFVFVLVDSIRARVSHPSSIVQSRKASETPEHLASQGHIAAQKRRADTTQMCNHLGVSFNEDTDERADISPMEIDGVRVNEAGTDDADGQTQHHQHDEDGRSIPVGRRDQDLHRVEDTVPQHELPSSSQLDWAQAAATLLDHSPTGTQDQQQSMAAALSFGEGGNEMLGSLYPEDFSSLTGVR